MILITGANGFIGSALVWSLNQRGREDLILCDKKEKLNQRPNLKSAKYFTFLDVSELFFMLQSQPWAKKIDTVLHIGACADTTEMDVDYLRETNVVFSQKLCDWSLAQGARFIYASSAAVYGEGELGFSDEDYLTPRLKPLNPYGRSKWEVDMWVLDKNLIDQVVGLRFFNVFGPNEYHKGAMASVIFRAFPMARDKGKVRLFKSHKEGFGDGEQKRDFIYVKDVIRIVEFFMEHSQAHGIFNVGTGNPSSFNQLATHLLNALGKKPIIEYFDMPEELQPKYQYFTQATINRLKKSGYKETFTPFDTAVTDYVKRYLTPGKVLS